MTNWGLPGGSVVKNPPANSGDAGSIPKWRRSPGVGNGNPLQCSCLKNFMDRRAWWATVHGVAKSQTRLSMHPILTDWHCLYYYSALHIQFTPLIFTPRPSECYFIFKMAVLEMVIEKSMTVGWPTTCSWRLHTTSPSSECTFCPSYPQWEPFSRLDLWESTVFVRLSGQYTWLNPRKTSV